MKLSLNLIRWMGHGDALELPLNELVDKINAQLGALEEEPYYLGALYEGIVVAKIVSCEKHSNADKLNVCLIDDAGVVKDVPRDQNGLVQVVCGAPNARAGLTVAWLPPGVTVPASVGKDPFVLEAREIRGVVSNGMLASPSELAISEDHSGILEIAEDEVGAELMKPGTPFKNLYSLDDHILEIENKMFTHRPDLFGHLGVGREIAGIQHKAFETPASYKFDTELPSAEVQDLPLKFTNELPNEVPRFVLVSVSAKAGKSPVWLQSWLSRLGIHSINNIVDLTNLYMMITGQPLHAYDYDKVKALSGSDGAHIVVRNPRSGEKIKLLNGKEIEPRPEAIMIATDQQLIGVGGIMGGSETEVDENTKNIILEAGTFDMYSIRRTSMFHGLFTDAVTRFNKGQSPLQNTAVARAILADILELTNGQVGNIVDDNHLEASVMERGSLHVPVTVSAEFINARLGLQLSPQEIQTLLQNVEFQVGLEGENLSVKAPFWRTDIELREDVVEEVGRLYGYDHLPLELPIRDLTPTRRDPLFDLKAQVRETLAQAGANELLTYSFVHGDLLTKVGQNKDQAYQISNALSPDLQYYRLSLAPSLLEKVHPNIKASYDNFALFEIGKAHVVGREEDGVPIEFERVSLVLAANKKAASQYAGAPYYEAKKYVTTLLKAFGIADKAEFEPFSPDEKGSATVYYEPGRAATIKVDGKTVGRVGEYKASVRSALKLPAFTAGFELGLGPLAELKTSKKYVQLPKFPGVTQDITLKVPSGLTYKEIFDFVRDELVNIQPQSTLPTLKPIDIYQKEDDAEHKQVTLRLEIASYDRTLTDTEVNKLLDQVAEAARQKFQAERI